MTAPLVWLIDDPATPAALADRGQADTLGLPVVDQKPSTGFYLYRTADGLVLQHAEAGAHSHPVMADLHETVARRTPGARRSPLARACGLRREATPTLVDATAGLGRDSVLLAALGAHVQPIERQPALYALLHDARQRLADSAGPETPLGARLAWPRFVEAGDWLAGIAPGARDVIYLDPMFDDRRRKARPQKALAWLAELAGPDNDAADLLAIARQRAGNRVVVKQHARSAPLAKPSHQITGKAIRFDVYLTDSWEHRWLRAGAVDTGRALSLRPRLCHAFAITGRTRGDASP